MTTAQKMSPQAFERIRDIVYASAGIALTERKEALVSARVGKRVRHLALPCFDAYLDYLDHNPDELVGLLDSISTNVTSFFREPHHFEFIGEVLGEWYASGQRRFRFWSAACSSGEEPYSLAMTVKEALPYPDVDARILATDISTQVLSRCVEGCYGPRQMATVPDDKLDRWFTRTGRDADSWQISAELRRMCVFKRLNLAAPPFPMSGPMDIILCRNVMIYFDDPVRVRLLHETNRLLKPGGHLIVGHAESLAGILSDFKYERPAIYRKA